MREALPDAIREFVDLNSEPEKTLEPERDDPEELDEPDDELEPPRLDASPPPPEDEEDPDEPDDVDVLPLPRGTA